MQKSRRCVCPQIQLSPQYLKQRIFIVFFSSVDIEELVNARIWVEKDAEGKTFYGCSVCNYSQKLRKDVAKHVERRHMNLCIPCPYLCGNTFGSRTELRTHIKAKHEA